MNAFIKVTALSLVIVAAFSSQGIAGNNGTTIQTNGNTDPVAGLSWRCGKNNPASWGTFGNGCLKQKRNKKKSTAIVVPTNAIMNTN
ncbi:MAG: hypothetical protein ACTSY1_06485 [Alphaproteobacteria bacterium]